MKRMQKFAVMIVLGFGLAFSTNSTGAEFQCAHSYIFPDRGVCELLPGSGSKMCCISCECGVPFINLCDCYTSVPQPTEE